jgi:hypothetical protein
LLFQNQSVCRLDNQGAGQRREAETLLAPQVSEEVGQHETTIPANTKIQQD